MRTRRVCRRRGWKSGRRVSPIIDHKNMVCLIRPRGIASHGHSGVGVVTGTLVGSGTTPSDCRAWLRQASIRVHGVGVDRGCERIIGGRRTGGTRRRALIQNECVRGRRVEQDVQWKSARLGISDTRRGRTSAGIRIDQRKISIVVIEGKGTYVVPIPIAPLGEHIQNSRRPGGGTATIEQQQTEGAHARERNDSS